jgi:hypothetical protein
VERVLAERPSATGATVETDAEVLLEGEDPASAHVDDAVHWVKVYGELCTVKFALLEHSDGLLHRGSAEPTDGDADQRMLRAEADRLARRLEYWTQRTKQLVSAGRGASETPACNVGTTDVNQSAEAD